MASQGDIEREKSLKILNEKYREKMYVLRTLKKDDMSAQYFINLLSDKNLNTILESFKEFSVQKKENKLSKETREKTLSSWISFLNNNDFKIFVLHYLFLHRKILFPYGEINPYVNAYKNLVDRMLNPRTTADELKTTAERMRAFIEKLDFKVLISTFDQNMKMIENIITYFVLIVYEQSQKVKGDVSKLITAIRREAMFELDKVPNNARLVRQRNRCSVDGRARGYFRFSGTSRHSFRRMVSRGSSPGFRKASW